MAEKTTNSRGHVAVGIVNIIEGLKQGRIRDGNLMVIIGAGIGWVWGATCVKWGPCET